VNNEIQIQLEIVMINLVRIQERKQQERIFSRKGEESAEAGKKG
jgi:hypothetical protein